MAQNRKATEEEIRRALRDALGKAKVVAQEAYAEYLEDGSLESLRASQVATDAFEKVNAELRQFDSARSIDDLRRADANPRRAKASWPVGKPYDESRPPVKVGPPKPPREKPDLPPPPPPRPPVLADRRTAGGEERISWWVQKDRATLNDGARALEKLPPSKTAAVPSKSTIRKTQQKVNEEARMNRKVEKTREADVEELSQTLEQKLKPSMGAFSVIPQAD